MGIKLAPSHEATIEATGFKAIQEGASKPRWDDRQRPYWKLHLEYEGRTRFFDFWNNQDNKPPTKAEALSMLLSDATSGLLELAESLVGLWGCENDDLYELANVASELESSQS